jgi:hypothetical protein
MCNVLQPQLHQNLRIKIPLIYWPPRPATKLLWRRLIPKVTSSSLLNRPVIKLSKNSGVLRYFLAFSGPLNELPPTNNTWQARLAPWCCANPDVARVFEFLCPEERPNIAQTFPEYHLNLAWDRLRASFVRDDIFLPISGTENARKTFCTED